MPWKKWPKRYRGEATKPRAFRTAALRAVPVELFSPGLGPAVHDARHQAHLGLVVNL